MTPRRVAILLLVALAPMLAALPLYLLPSTDTTKQDVPPRKALEAWSEEVLTGAQLPDAAPARRYGSEQRVDGRSFWVLGRGDDCWGVPMGQPADGPRQLDPKVCRRR